MINLHQRYNHYLQTGRKHDKVDERVIGYGWTDDGYTIDGYYVLTNTYKLFYNLQEQFLRKENWKGGRVVDCISLEN